MIRVILTFVLMIVSVFPAISISFGSATGSISTKSIPPARTGSNGDVLTIADNGANLLEWAAGGGGGSGTVTSVGLSGDNGVTISNSPVTTSGTIGVTLGAITPLSIVSAGIVNGTSLGVTSQYKLPSTAGANGYALTSDGNGVTSWTQQSSTAYFLEETFTNETQVTVTHNFGHYPVVQVITENGTDELIYEITHTDTDEFVVDFAAESNGTIIATLGAGGGSGGSGTVTSVAATGDNGISLTGSPITTTGTLALTLDLGSIDISDLNNDAGFTNNTGTVTSVALDGDNGFALKSGSPITGTGTLVGTLNLASINTSALNNDAGFTANTGTVTSVGLTGDNGVTISSSPVTTSGNIGVTLGAITPLSVVSAGKINGTTLTASTEIVAKGLTINGNYAFTKLAATEGYVLVYNGGILEWQNPAFVTGTKPEHILHYEVSELYATESSFAPLEELDAGTQEHLVAAYDDTTEEYRNAKLIVPSDPDTSGSVTFLCYVSPKTGASSKNIGLTFGHRAVGNGEAMDGVYTDVDTGANAITSTTNSLGMIEWSETFATLGWAANDMVYFRISRDPSVTNDLSGDLYLHSCDIRIPRS